MIIELKYVTGRVLVCNVLIQLIRFVSINGNKTRERGTGEHEPDVMGEKNEPTDIKQNSTAKKNSIRSGKALTATLNSHKSKQTYPQINQRYSIVQCS